jgi:hypothetical protein
MKHLFTIEKELTMFVKAFPDFNVSAFFSDEPELTSEKLSTSRNELPANTPDPQIIKNIVNYARSLEVLKPATGAAMFLIQN